jgi:hypothetical protein
VLAATLFDHRSAGFGVHVPASLDDDAGLGVLHARVCRSGWPARVGSGCAEEAGKSGDDFGQQGVDPVLFVVGVAVAEVGDSAAVLGFAGELADPRGDGGVDRGRAARAGAVSRG